MNCGFTKTTSLYAKINNKIAEAVNTIHSILYILGRLGQ